MKAKLLIVAVVALFVAAACSKDKYTTSPQLKFKSVNSDVFPQGAQLIFKMGVTDKEGDIQDTMWIQKISYTCTEGNITAFYIVPSFTGSKDLSAEIAVNLSYGNINSPYPPISGCTQRDDSCYFRFWLKDQGGNVSDTVSSPVIKLLKG